MIRNSCRDPLTLLTPLSPHSNTSTACKKYNVTYHTIIGLCHSGGTISLLGSMLLMESAQPVRLVWQSIPRNIPRARCFGQGKGAGQVKMFSRFFEPSLPLIPGKVFFIYRLIVPSFLYHIAYHVNSIPTFVPSLHLVPGVTPDIHTINKGYNHWYRVNSDVSYQAYFIFLYL